MMLYLMLVGRLPERGMQVMLYAAMGIFLVRSVVYSVEKKIHRIEMIAVIIFWAWYYVVFHLLVSAYISLCSRQRRCRRSKMGREL